MPSQIKLKRTFGVGLPDFPPVGTGVTDGELVYVYDTGDVGAGGTYKKLYIGDGINGVSSLPSPVGGQYYMERLPDDLTQEGVLAPRKVLSVNENSVIDRIQVGNGLSVSGVSTFYSDVRIEGDLTITDDLIFDEFEARQFVVTGVGTINNALTIGATLDVPNAFINAGIITDIVGTAATITSIDTDDADILSAKITAGIITDIVGTAATITSLDTDAIDALAANIVAGIITDVVGIAATITTLDTDTIDALSARITAGIITNIVGTAATITTIDANAADIVTATIGSGIVTDIQVSGASTVTGIATFQNDVFIGGNLNIIGDVVYDEVTGRNLNITGVATIENLNAGVATITTLHSTDLNLNAGVITSITGTYATITNLVGTAATIDTLDIPVNLDVDGHTELDNANVSGIITVSSLDVSNNFDVYDLEAEFHNDVHIHGNLSVAGTFTNINQFDLFVENKDIILGVATNSSNDDISTDNTANGGGIAIASTEGSPLVNLTVSGVTTTDILDQYKQIMWFKHNTFGVGTTDAFLFNYAVGVGSTNVPNQAYMAVGNHVFYKNVFQSENLDVLNADILDAKITAGIITDIVGTAATITNIDSDAADIVTATIGSGIVTDIQVSGAATVSGNFDLDSDLHVTGISTFVGITTQESTLFANQVNVSGVSTFANHVHLGDDDELRFGAGNDFKIYHDPNDARIENSNGDIKFKNTGSYFFFDEDGGETLASFINDGAVNLYYDASKKFETTAVGATVIGNLESQTLNVTGVSTVVGVATFQDDVYIDGNLNVIGDIVYDEVSGRNLDISGVGTIANFNSGLGTITVLHSPSAFINAGIITDIVGTAATITSVDTEALDALNANINAGLATNFAITNANIQTGIITDAYINAGVITSLVGTYATITEIDIDNADILDAKITAGIITDIVGTAATITTLDVQNGDILTATIGAGIITDIQVSGASTFTGIATFQSDIFVGGNLNVAGDIVYDEVVGRNIFISGVGTFANIEIGTASTNTINSLTGALTLDSEIGNNVAINTHTNVVGFLSASDGIYYDLGDFNGPNGIAYFDSSGLLVSSGATTASISTSNYLVTTDASGIPVWTNVFDGGSF